MLDERPQTVGMTSANFKPRDVALAKVLEFLADKVREQHPFGSAFNEDRGIGKKQIGVSGAQVALGETARLLLISKSLCQVDDCTDRNCREGALGARVVCRITPEIPDAGELHLMG